MKALIFGSLNIDHVYKVDHFVQPGETMESFDLKLYCGGKGLNQAIAFAKCGVETWMAGAVGAGDSQMLLDCLKDAGVETELVMKKDGPSGHAIIQNVPDGENCIILFGGANQQITKEDTDQVLSHFEEGDFLILQNEINQLPYIMEQAHKMGMQIVLNPSPMNEKIMALPLEYVDYFILNEVEGAAIAGSSEDTTGRKPTEANTTEINAAGANTTEINAAEANTTEADDAKANTAMGGNARPDGDAILAALQQRFPETRIVLTLGGEGSVYGYKNEKMYQEIFKVKAVDTTAAGDTYTGYFFGSLMRGKSISEALRIASKAASIAVSKNGASVSIPLIEEVLTQLD